MANISQKEAWIRKHGDNARRILADCPDRYQRSRGKPYNRLNLLEKLSGFMIKYGYLSDKQTVSYISTLDQLQIVTNLPLK